ncbi:hypothetical protein [Streptomyces platensis]|uniref:hypothetical protein n=1 Tax=Streptomyces platensis TaxID=58346 RepID=UPI003317748C
MSNGIAWIFESLLRLLADPAARGGDRTMSDSPTTRLLPWVSPDGKTCILLSDGRGESAFSRVADRMEDVQLEMADGLLDHAADLLGDDAATDRQLRYLGEQLSAALRDVRRVAGSRGARLGADG